MIDYNISKYIDTDEPNAEPNIDSTEALNAVDITDNAEAPNADINDDIIPDNNEAETTEAEGIDISDANTKHNTKVPDILGNNKLGYNIWDTIVKGV